MMIGDAIEECRLADEEQEGQQGIADRRIMKHGVQAM